VLARRRPIGSDSEAQFWYSKGLEFNNDCSCNLSVFLTMSPGQDSNFPCRGNFMESESFILGYLGPGSISATIEFRLMLMRKEIYYARHRIRHMTSIPCQKVWVACQPNRCAGRSIRLTSRLMKNISEQVGGKCIIFFVHYSFCYYLVYTHPLNLFPQYPFFFHHPSISIFLQVFKSATTTSPTFVRAI
jgi:hypothetical protein